MLNFTQRALRSSQELIKRLNNFTEEEVKTTFIMVGETMYNRIKKSGQVENQSFEFDSKPSANIIEIIKVHESVLWIAEMKGRRKVPMYEIVAFKNATSAEKKCFATEEVKTMIIFEN